MDKREHDTLETIDLDNMDRVSGGCANCQQGAAAAGTGQSSQGGQKAGAILQQVLGAIGGMKGG
jgi:hypothetical protein